MVGEAQPTVPRGAKLDVAVMWAVGVLQSEPGYVGSGDIGDYVANKQGIDPQAQLGAEDVRAIRRSLERLEDQYLIQYETGDGYRLGPESE